jgi:hypothetical protein
MSHRGLAEAEALGDLPCSQSGVDQASKRVLVDATPRCVTVAMHCRQPVPLHPIADRRRMAGGQLADLVEREALA